MERIAAINRQLALNMTPDAASATLLDQRDMYIDELSQLMDIRVVSTDHNQINVFTNSGIQLVGTEAARLAFDAQGTMMPAAQWTADPATRAVGTLTLVTPTGGSVDLLANNAIRSGEIAAYVEMRDYILPEAQAQLDAIAAAMASGLSDATIPGTAVTSGAQQGYDLDTAGLLAGNSINLTWTDSATGQQHRVTIVRVDDPAALPLSNDATAAAGDTVIGVDFSGGLAGVAAQLNSLFNGRLTFSNPSGTTLRVLDDGAANNSTIDAASATITRTGFASGGAHLPFFTDAAAPYTGAITANGTQSVGLAGRLVVNAQLVADPAKLVVYQTGVSSGDSTRPNFIIGQLLDASTTFSAKTGIGSVTSPFSGSLSSFLRQVISTQGEAAENASNLAAGQEVVVNALKARVAEASAVNIDVEMANLLSLQSAYGANARVLSVVKEMMDRLAEYLRPAMSIGSVGTRSLLLTQSLVDMRTQLGDLQRQLATGKRADDYAGIGIQRGLTVGLRSHLSAIGSYNDTITSVGVRLDLAQTALTRVADIGRETKAVAADMTSVAGRATAQATADSALGEILGLLNTRAGDRYIFSGLSSDQPAVQSLSLIMDGDAGRAGFKQVVAERLQADLGARRARSTRRVVARADRRGRGRRDSGNGIRFQARGDLVVARGRDRHRSRRHSAASCRRSRRHQSECG